MYQLTGIVKVKNDTQVISEKFQKREFVVTENSGPYPQDILFQLTQERVTLLDPVNQGEQVTVSFNLRGREWTNKEGKVMYFNSLDVWKIEQAAAGGTPPPPMEEPPIEAIAGDDDDDLPF